MATLLARLTDLHVLAPGQPAFGVGSLGRARFVDAPHAPAELVKAAT